MNIKQVVNDRINFHLKHTVPRQNEGEAYYFTLNPDIMSRKKGYYSKKNVAMLEDPYKANNKIAGSYAKLLVDQKLGYSLNVNMAVDTDNEVLLDNTLSLKSYKKYLRQVAKEASNKMYGVLQFYINDKQELDYKVIPSQQIIRIENEYDDDKLDAVIRFYKCGEDMHKAEYWDKDFVYYLTKVDGEYELDAEVNPSPHIVASEKIGSRVTNAVGKSWGRVPFCFLENNDESQRDIDPVVPLLRVWDIVISDFANNLEDFQDVYWVLKNYQGQDVEEFFDEVRRLKVIKTGEDGGATTQQIDIPTEARDKMLMLLEKMIYKFGRGVDTSNITGNVTNVQIYSMYSALDLKANEFEMQVQEFFDDCLDVVNMYNSLKNIAPINVNNTDLKFKRSMILNKGEIIDSLIKQVGFISRQTLLSLHPDINDVDAELELIKAEAEEDINSLDDNLGFGDDVIA